MISGHLPELFILVIITLVIFGPKRVPEIGASLGQGIRNFRKGVSEIEERASSHVAQSDGESLQLSSGMKDHHDRVPSSRT
jgi:sec-independent protein translocase protein TatA